MTIDPPGALAAAATAPMIFKPVLTSGWARALAIVAAYGITLALSGRLVAYFVLPRKRPRRPAPDPDGPRFDTSTLIGKCENILTVTLVLLGQETGLALIFTAKSFVRKEEIEKNPGFFLGGTLVNMVWGILVAGVARWLVRGL
ncbi:MAG: hypothetical protein ACRD6R_09515 [Candidatus Polarisedimenticolia bacterium]